MMTGNYRFRQSLFGRLILQVEESGRWGYSWRDAKVADITKLKLD